MRFARAGRALLVRILFLAHGLLAVKHVASVFSDARWWLLVIPNIGLFVETGYTVIKRKGEEWRWICLSAVCYLCATVPAICSLELNRHSNGVENTTNQTEYSNVTTESSIKPSSDRWVEITLLLLIFGRWRLLKRELSRDELYQLLSIYISIASDVMEFFQLFGEKTVRKDTALSYSILVVWSISLFQFTLILTASRNPIKAKPVAPARANNIVAYPQDSESGETTVVCCGTEWHEILGLFSTLLMMDGPFLVIRLYVMCALKLVTYKIIFFTVKNVTMIALTLYRCFVIINDFRKQRERGHNTFHSSKDSTCVDNSAFHMDFVQDAAAEVTNPGDKKAEEMFTEGHEMKRQRETKVVSVCDRESGTEESLEVFQQEPAMRRKN